MPNAEFGHVVPRAREQRLVLQVRGGLAETAGDVRCHVVDLVVSLDHGRDEGLVAEIDLVADS